MQIQVPMIAEAAGKHITAPIKVNKIKAPAKTRGAPGKQSKAQSIMSKIDALENERKAISAKITEYRKELRTLKPKL